MSFDVAKKIKLLNALADGSLSMLSLGDHKWLVHAYQNDTLVGNSSFYGETLEEVLDKILKEVIDV
jgi:hypothetical protein